MRGGTVRLLVVISVGVACYHGQPRPRDKCLPTSGVSPPTVPCRSTGFNYSYEETASPNPPPKTASITPTTLRKPYTTAAQTKTNNPLDISLSANSNSLADLSNGGKKSHVKPGNALP